LTLGEQEKPFLLDTFFIHALLLLKLLSVLISPSISTNFRFNFLAGLLEENCRVDILLCLEIFFAGSFR
jgi:hypothetical protein